MSPRGDEFINATTPFLALATITVAFRLYTRIYITKNPGWEDFLVLIAWVRCFLARLFMSNFLTSVTDIRSWTVFDCYLA